MDFFIARRKGNAVSKFNLDVASGKLCSEHFVWVFAEAEVKLKILSVVTSSLLIKHQRRSLRLIVDIKELCLVGYSWYTVESQLSDFSKRQHSLWNIKLTHAAMLDVPIAAYDFFLNIEHTAHANLQGPDGLPVDNY